MPRKSESTPSLATASFSGRVKLVAVADTYEEMVERIRTAFKLFKSQEVVLLIQWGERQVELDSSAYCAVQAHTELIVKLEDEDASSCEGTSSVDNLSTRHTIGASRRGHTIAPVEFSNTLTPSRGPIIWIRTLTGKTFSVPFSQDDLITDIKARIQAIDQSIPPDDQRLIFKGRQMEVGRTCAEYGLYNDATVHVVRRLRGGKPVIYILSPTHLDSVRVTLTLSVEWHFSVVYPLAKPILDLNGRSTIEWHVSADPSGELTEKHSGLKLSYLFWEALSSIQSMASLHQTQLGDDITSSMFNPTNPSLTPDNAAVLPFGTFLVHLDAALSALALSVGARNDFVTYWLPAFTRFHERGQHIAFRFLAQDDYARKACLDVTPAPEVVTRVFLLFGGVAAPSSLSHDPWATAREFASQVDWRCIVGVRGEALDTSKYRVLEWGGMEVHLME